MVVVVVVVVVLLLLLLVRPFLELIEPVAAPIWSPLVFVTSFLRPSLAVCDFPHSSGGGKGKGQRFKKIHQFSSLAPVRLREK